MALRDASKILAWRQSDRARFLHEGARTLEEQIAWMSVRPATEFNFVIECTCGSAVGMLSLVDVDENSRSAEPARFIIDRQYSKGGFAVSAMALLYDFAFRELSLELLKGHIAQANRAMLRWHVHFGMEVIGETESTVDIRGVGRSLVSIELRADKYRAFTEPLMRAAVQNLVAAIGPHNCACSLSRQKTSSRKMAIGPDRVDSKSRNLNQAKGEL
jgi:RimJ/RimL family protein N-acetyltransferase